MAKGPSEHRHKGQRAQDRDNGTGTRTEPRHNQGRQTTRQTKNKTYTENSKNRT